MSNEKKSVSSKDSKAFSLLYSNRSNTWRSSQSSNDVICEWGVSPVTKRVKSIDDSNSQDNFKFSFKDEVKKSDSTDPLLKLMLINDSKTQISPSLNRSFSESTMWDYRNKKKRKHKKLMKRDSLNSLSINEGELSDEFESWFNDKENRVLQAENANEINPFQDSKNIDDVSIDFDDILDSTNSIKPVDDFYVDDEDLLSAFSAVKSDVNQDDLALNLENDHFKRFLVMEVVNEYYEDQSKQKMQKVLKLLDSKRNLQYKCFLRDEWNTSPVEIGDYVNIIGDINDGSIIIDSGDNGTKNFLILHPDFLFSGTSIANSFACIRRAVLQERIKSTDEKSYTLLLGTLIHELFQSCLESTSFETFYLKKKIEDLIVSYLDDLYLCSVNEERARNDMLLLIPKFQNWSQRYFWDLPKSIGKLSTKMNSKAQNAVCVSNILQIEENITSPMYGMKGKIDVTCEMKMEKKFISSKINSELHTFLEPFLVPLEVKTGKVPTNASHTAQTLIYTLLLNDRYKIPIENSILYYTHTEEMIHIEASYRDILHILAARNMLAFHMKSPLSLPPMIENSYICKNCFQLETCLTFHKTIEKGDGKSSKLDALFDDKVGHITDNHSLFFEKWNKLLTLEESDLLKYKKEIWTMTGQEREALGRCMNDMIIKNVEELQKGSQFAKYLFTLVPNSQKYLLDYQFVVGDPIAVSFKNDYCIASGFVVNLNGESVQIQVDRDIRRVEPNRNPTPKHCLYESLKEYKSSSKMTSNPVYRIDKDELESGMRQCKYYLTYFMYHQSCTKLRELIIDLRKPIFKSTAADLSAETSMNPCQSKALNQVIRAEDYALILGMPTGKTTLIAQLVKKLSLGMNKTVLIASYTHNAVDNILLKVKELGIDFLRLGNSFKVHNELIKYTREYNSIKTVAELEMFYSSKRVVATTCLRMSHPIFTKKRFDYCIIDEASQITLPVSLGCLRVADVFVLVGDHYQLPPLVRNQDALKEGLATSLFKRLSEGNPDDLINLSYQYRMNRTICLLSSRLFYNDRLQCGNDDVANQVLPVSMKDFSLHHETEYAATCNGHECWLKNLMLPENAVLFLNTDQLGRNLEDKAGDTIFNPTEALIAKTIIMSLVASSIECSSISLLCPFKSQIKYMESTIPEDIYNRIQVSTIDKYQGKDNDCVIVSLVRSNAHNQIGDLLKQWQRINVLFTRAKKKFILIGSSETLSKGSALWKNVFDLMKQSSMISFFCLIRILLNFS